MKNMLNTFIWRCFAASRIRNLIAVLAITLTAVLFTTVTTICMGALNSITLTMQMLKGSYSDGEFRYMTAEQFALLKDADFIQEYGLRMPVGFLTNTTGHNIELDIMDETQTKLMFSSPSHGTMPKAANEVVASDLAIRELGAEPEIGAKIPIEFSVRGKEYHFEMVVSGWFEAVNTQMSVMGAGTAFRDAYPEIFVYTYQQDSEIAGTYWSDIVVRNPVRLQDKMEDWIRGIGGKPYLVAVVNTMTNPQIALPTLLMGMVVVLLFILCGYLLIYNVFDIAVMQEIQRFGLYRTIGMGKNQVEYLMNQQALWLSCIGIPIGLGIGFFIGKATLPVVMESLTLEYKNVAITVSPSPIIFVGAAALTALTVFLSTRKPIRVATNIPPIEALRYMERTNKKAKYSTRRSALGASLTQLAWLNLGRNKRRSIVIMISLMLCMVLLNSVGIVASSMDVEKQVDYIIRTDYAVTNVAVTNVIKGFTLREQGLSKQIMDTIDAQAGVTYASAVYKNTLEDINVTYDFGLEFTKLESYSEEGVEIRYGIADEYYTFTIGNDGRAHCNVYGMEEEAIARMDIQEGETDTHILYGKMLNGEGVLVGIPADRSTMKINKFIDFVELGDSITVYKDGKPLRELRVLAKAAINGDDQEIGYASHGTFLVGNDGLYLYMPASIYKEIYDEPTIYKYGFDVEEAQRENMTAFLENYIKNVDTSINYLSAESARKNALGTQSMIRFVGGLVGIIFAVAGILNLMNTMFTTVLTRRHEFATMQSIGMTDRQLICMMLFEGIYYALGACVIGLVTSVGIGYFMVQELLKSMWMFTFHFTIVPALITCVALLVVGAVIPVVALKLFYKGSIVEKLRILE